MSKTVKNKRTKIAEKSVADKLVNNKKTAIILFNLGGPDKPSSVKKFLFNLFNDKHIIPLPAIFRYVLAWFISFRREDAAKKNYAHMGGKSPIYEETKKQADALREELSGKIDSEFEIFISMRHWHPMSDEVAARLRDYMPDEVILLPLYPQFSMTTSYSAIEDFKNSMHRNFSKSAMSKIVLKTVCCYPDEEYFIKSHAELITESIGKIKNKDNYRILFSAHGLPVKNIKSGDPYQWQIENTVKSITNLLSIKNLDYKITYQSKVGRLEWLTPSTEDEIKLAAEQGKEMIIVPVAFVSEHIETLVELDIEYKEIANQYGVNYIRVPALGINKSFVKSLSRTILKFSKKEGEFLSSASMSRICPKNCNKCPC
ncbi:MAG: ferrochelatase [Rickettsiales bacterium]|nr:MAG: ferrochelatase [Rickettsiales bacterium]